MPAKQCRVLEMRSKHIVGVEGAKINVRAIESRDPARENGSLPLSIPEVGDERRRRGLAKWAVEG